MNWGIEDLAAAAVLIGGAAIALTIVLRSIRNAMLRAILAIGIILGVLAIWAHLAVGIFV
jgi:hypothetical protein